MREKKHTFQTNKLSVRTGKLKNPVRIALLSDLHLREYGENNADLAAAVKASQPDMIAVTGDLMIRKNPDIAIPRRLCQKLCENVPTYFVIGNHEYSNIKYFHSDYQKGLREAGVQVLESEFKTVEINGNKIDIAGLPHYPHTFTLADRQMIEEFTQTPNFHLLLVHDPGFFDPRVTTNPEKTLIGKNIDAALCGHRHGGQVEIPLIGGLFMPCVGLFPNLTTGDNLVGSTHVIVSRGLGDHVVIPRINNPHELLIITLE